MDKQDIEKEITRDELPEVLEPIHIQQFLKLGRKNLYEFLNDAPFHINRVGRLFKIPKKSFLDWFDGKQEIEIVQRDKNGDPVKIKYNGYCFIKQYK